MTDLHAQIARLCVEMRQHAGLTESELATRSGVGRSTIVRFEDYRYRGHTVSYLLRIAEACHCNIDTIWQPTVDTPSHPLKSPDDATQPMERGQS